MSKDWTGGQGSIFSTLGSSHHSDGEREENDYYATDPEAVEHLLKMHRLSDDIWECACGEGHLSRKMEIWGKRVKSTDLVDRGYGQSGVDFLKCNEKWGGIS